LSVLPILTYPNPLLKEKVPEADLADPELDPLLEVLVGTLRHHAGCVGLAASQVGHLRRCLVVDVSSSPRAGKNHGLVELINPRIVEASQWKTGREGCLSFPDLLANVKRAQRIRVEGYNRKKERVDLSCEGFEAVAIQHEIDHLDGILFLDRVRSSKDLFERRKAAV
jgi:peptide deformylase